MPFSGQTKKQGKRKTVSENAEKALGPDALRVMKEVAGVIFSFDRLKTRVAVAVVCLLPVPEADIRVVPVVGCDAGVLQQVLDLLKGRRPFFFLSGMLPVALQLRKVWKA